MSTTGARRPGDGRVAAWNDRRASARTSPSAALDLARRFAAGATMWCVAPAWPEHARHVAVEFVHPVIVGKRALPAVAVDGADPVAALRPVAAAGDVLVLVGDAATTRGRRALLRRAEAWGLTTVWIGAGDAPAGRRRPTTCCGLDGDARRARHDGRSCWLYHLLWELTHVCFEHPGPARRRRPTSAGEVVHHLLRRGPPGRGASRSTTDGLATRAHGARRRDGRHDARRRRSRPGDLVLVHAGTAIAVVRRAVDDDRLPLPVPRGRRARRRRRCSTTSPRSAEAKAATSDALASRDARARARRRSSAAAGAMAERFARRRPAVHVRQRRQLDRRRRRVAALFAAPPCGPAAAGPLAWSTTRRCSPRSATTSASSSCSPASSSPTRRAGDIAARPVDERQLAQPARAPSPRPPRAACSRSAWPATTAARWRARRRRRPLPRRALRQRPPHPGDAGARSAFALWAAVQERLADAAMADARPTPAIARPRSSSASRRSAAAGRGSPTRSSRSPTAPAARRRPRSSTPCSSRRSPTTSAGAAAATRPRSTCPAASAWRSAPTRSSCAPPVPRRLDRSPRRARHGQRRRRAGRPAAVALGRVRDRGGLRRRRAARHRRRHGRGGRGGRRARS